MEYLRGMQGFMFAFNNVSFFSASVRHFERGVVPRNEVGILQHETQFVFPVLDERSFEVKQSNI